MMEKIDWNEILQEAGDSAWVDDFVYVPRSARILLSKFVAEDRFITREGNQVYYGPESQAELYNAAKTAYSSLQNPLRKPDYIYYVRKDWGPTGFDFVGTDRIRISGPSFKLVSASAYYLPVFFRDETRLADCYAFSCTVVTAVCSSNAWFYMFKENLQTLTANVPITNKRYLVKLQSYMGDTSGFDFVKTAGTLDPNFFQTFTAGSQLTQSNFTGQILVGMRPFVLGATVTIELENIVYHDVNGKDIYI